MFSFKNHPADIQTTDSSKILPPTSTINGALVLYYQTLSTQAKPTGKTRHYSEGNFLNNLFSQLAICQYLKEGKSDENKPVYLFYCDINWKVLTDTYHENVEDAKNQAEFEFGGSNQLWKKFP